MPPQPVPSPWTKPSHSEAACASVMPGRITPWTCSIAAAAMSFASCMRSSSCGVLIMRASLRSGVASCACGKASNQAFGKVVGSPIMRSAACVPSESSMPTASYCSAAAAAMSSARSAGGRGSTGS